LSSRIRRSTLLTIRVKGMFSFTICFRIFSVWIITYTKKERGTLVRGGTLSNKGQRQQNETKKESIYIYSFNSVHNQHSSVSNSKCGRYFIQEVYVSCKIRKKERRRKKKKRKKKEKRKSE